MDDTCFRIGNTELFVDEELVEFDIPIFFICTDKYDHKYAVLCVDSNELIYVVCKTELDDLIAVLTSKVTLYDFFVKCQEKWRVYTGDDYSEDKVEQVGSLQDDELPVKDTYFELSNTKIAAYIERLNREKKSLSWSIIFNETFLRYCLDQRRSEIDYKDSFDLNEHDYVWGVERLGCTIRYFSHNRKLSLDNQNNSIASFSNPSRIICFNNEVSCYV